ncbi:MAG: hypothetical protein ACE5DZ_06350 [Mariprofundus sp.]
MIDFSGLFSQLLSTYWWLLPLFIIAALCKSAWFKGVMGEAMVNLAARLFLDKNDDYLIKNVNRPGPSSFTLNALRTAAIIHE